MPKETRVLVVDDSATMRRLIRMGIEADPHIRVVAEAGSAREARDAVTHFAPDVITLDIEMPGMNGLEFLERLMRARPTPVVMVSSWTADGSEAAIRALSLGAVDCIEKPRFGSAGRVFLGLADRLRVASGAQVGRGIARSRAAAPITRGDWAWNGKRILIGSSTGGVEALETILKDFPADCPPTLITQHMPAQFLVSFAARLNSTVAPAVRIAGDGDRLSRGAVLIAPGDAVHMRLDQSGETVTLADGPKRTGHRPSVDELFLSAVPSGDRTIAAILTGMGRDGAEGMRDLRRAKAICVAQDEATSVIYGMPRQAKELGGVERELPLGEIASYLIRQASK